MLFILYHLANYLLTPLYILITQTTHIMQNHKKFKLNQIQLQSDKDKIDLEQKKSSDVIIQSSSEFFSRSICVHETDWEVCELDKISEATSITIEEMLPEKAKYDYSFTIDIPESYLQYLNFDVLAKTVPEQNITGVQEFNFASLQEVMIDVYEWHGVLSITGALGESCVWGGGLPTLSSPPASPPPAMLYDSESYYLTIKIMNLGAGISGILSADGSQMADGSGLSRMEWLESNAATWGTTVDMLRVCYTSGYSITFKEILNHNKFGCPEDLLPPGGLTDYSTSEYPSQYWSQASTDTFQEYTVRIGSYDDARDLIERWYNNILFTAKADGPPWHAYLTAVNNTVCIGDKQVIINKLDTDKFQISIKGYFLLLSKAITETSWSDPSFPTYEPNGEDMHTCLKVYLDSPLQTITYENYTF